MFGDNLCLIQVKLLRLFFFVYVPVVDPISPPLCAIPLHCVHWPCSGCAAVWIACWLSVQNAPPLFTKGRDSPKENTHAFPLTALFGGSTWKYLLMKLWCVFVGRMPWELSWAIDFWPLVSRLIVVYQPID